MEECQSHVSIRILVEPRNSGIVAGILREAPGKGCLVRRFRQLGLKLSPVFTASNIEFPSGVVTGPLPNLSSCQFSGGVLLFGLAPSLNGSMGSDTH